MKTFIEDKNYFKNANAFAKNLGGSARDTFKNCMKRLRQIQKNRDADLYLMPDWAKHSFYFSFVDPKTRRLVLNGGVILHGFGPTCSVSLSDQSGPFWSIHT